MFFREKIFKEGTDQVSIPLSVDKLRLARFLYPGCGWFSAQEFDSFPAQRLVGFLFSWSGGDLGLVSGPVLFLVFFFIDI